MINDIEKIDDSDIAVFDLVAENNSVHNINFEEESFCEEDQIVFDESEYKGEDDIQNQEISNNLIIKNNEIMNNQHQKRSDRYRKSSLLNDVLSSFDNDEPFLWQKKKAKDVPLIEPKASQKIFETFNKSQIPKEPSFSQAPSTAKSENEEGITPSLSFKQMTFLTQLSGEKYLQVASNPMIVEKNPQKNHQTKKKRMSPSMMMFYGAPSIPVTKKIDLSLYDGKDVYDIQENISKIPESLYPFIKWRQESLVFHSLCGSTLPSIKPSVLSAVIVELKQIQTQTVNNGMVYESAFIQNTIDLLKESHRKNPSKSIDPDKIIQRLNLAESLLDKQRKDHEIKVVSLDCERDLLLIELESKFEQEVEELNDYWSSESIQHKFNKPSSKLIELRQQARTFLNAHLFEEASQISQSISELEEEESERATLRMKESYQNAYDRLNKRYETDRNTVIETTETKRSKIIREYEQEERPLLNRIDNLNQKLDYIKKDEKRSSKKQITKATPTIIPKCSPVNLNTKLRLKPLNSTFISKSLN